MKSLTRTLNQWRSVRRTESELNRLTDRELNDLGLSRGDIPAVARRSAGY